MPLTLDSFHSIIRSQESFLMNWKARLKQAVPIPLYNKLMLSFPALYRTKLFCYESNLQGSSGIKELLCRLDTAMALKGNIIECGSSRCGTAIIMANHLRRKRVRKLIYACDSFEGFDPVEVGTEIREGHFRPEARNAFKSTSFDYVTQKIELLGLTETVVPVKGYFKDTLESIDSSYCLGFIDCDLGDSASYCVKAIWPKLVSQGILLFDDFRTEPMKPAIDRMLRTYRNQIKEFSEMERLFCVVKS